MEWKLEDLTMEQLKEVMVAVNKEITERNEKNAVEHVKDLVHALEVCLYEDNPKLNGYINLYDEELCEDTSFELYTVLEEVRDILKETLN